MAVLDREGQEIALVVSDLGISKPWFEVQLSFTIT
jgi:hypothetical protein